MINNNPYNIPQKKPLSQSKIISETNSSRHTSTYLQNRNGNQVMYSSSIFLKNPPSNGPLDQSFFEPIKQPLSPHHAKYSNAPSPVQFIPTYNLPPMRPPENHFFPVNVPKENPVEKSLIELREKIDKLQKRLEAKDLSLNHIQSKKTLNTLENDSMASFTEDSSNNGSGLRDLVSLMVEEAIEAQNKKIWQKINQIQQQPVHSLNDQQFIQKLSYIEESLRQIHAQKTHGDEHLVNRLKTIEKTIREMGEDIHLINDKEEHLSNKIQTDLPALKNQVLALKAIEKKFIDTDKKVGDSDKKMFEIKAFMDEVNKKLKLLEVSTQSASIASKLKQIQTKVQALKSEHKNVKPTFDRYLSEPCVLKYIEKYQVSKPQQQHSYSNSVKQAHYEQILVNEMTYFIDHEGYLLDNDRYYLMSLGRNERIRLDSKHIDLLRERKILI